MKERKGQIQNPNLFLPDTLSSKPSESERESASMEFISGGNITLRESLKFVDRGSRSPHPGGGNNMTTILMQLGIPTILFWEVKAALKGYDLTHLGESSVSSDREKCGPWAQFEKERWEKTLANLPQNIRNIVEPASTPYQAQLAISQAAFPGVVESSASFYLRYKDVVKPILETIGNSRFAIYFSKKVNQEGRITEARDQPGDIVRYADGTQLPRSDLARGYLRLLEVVHQSEENPSFNPVNSGIEGVLPDARIMSVLDSAIFATTANTDTVYAWSGVAMQQYILTSADSQRWREETSQMYSLARKEVILQLPEKLRFVLIPTQGLGELAVADEAQAAKINASIKRGSVPKEYNQKDVANNFRARVNEMDKQESLDFLKSQTPKSVHKRLTGMVNQNNLRGACGVAASSIIAEWRRSNVSCLDESREELSDALVEDGKYVLRNQPTVTTFDVLQGKRLYLLEGVSDIPTGKLESIRHRYQRMARKKIVQQNVKQDDDKLLFNRAGWRW